MLTVLNLFGLKFVIFTTDRRSPGCHVESADGSATFEIEDEVRLTESTLLPRELSLAKYVLKENMKNIRDAWEDTRGEHVPRREK